jgi:hypothetical protein
VHDNHEGSEAPQIVVDVVADVGPPPSFKRIVKVLVVAAHVIVDDGQEDVDQHEEPEVGAQGQELEDGPREGHQVQERLVGVVQIGRGGHLRQAGDTSRTPGLESWQKRLLYEASY